MNQLKKSTESLLLRILFCFLFAFLSFSGMFLLLSYLLFRLPNFENYYFLFSPVLLIFECFFICIYCMRMRSKAVMFSVLTASLISLTSLIVGVLLGGFASFNAGKLILHALFILTNGLMQVLLQNKRPTKKRRAPFKK